ncbi:hypothetical protein A3N99_02750 [Mycobacteroides abscessus]|uniref:hypothetical protein n=1 Tax=Mycobacteroides abscessus TaxID=36809 RepID=UPI00078E86F2|nr:hypothetical protein [Mycobacteroides abscessus]AMU39229.1 hypothetical protein A3N99_02750 [Mycobacteroides abscessus]
MTDCRKCRRKSDLFLCNLCIEELTGYLAELAWLVEQLDVTVARQDKLTTGAVGHSSDNPSPINFGAMEIARRAQNTITTIIRDLCETRGIEYVVMRPVGLDFIGPLQPDQQRVRSWRPRPLADMCEWLAKHAHAIASDEGAVVYYNDTKGLHDEITRVINRPDRHFAGPCPTVKGYSRTGKPIECGKFLYAGSEDPSTVCPVCKATVDVKRNRQRSWLEGDLMTERVLLKRLSDIDEPVSRVRFYEWIRKGKIRPQGWLHKGVFVEHYIKRGDPRVFSFRAVRQLREAELKATGAATTEATSAVEIPHEMLQTATAVDSRRLSRSYGQGQSLVTLKLAQILDSPEGWDADHSQPADRAAVANYRDFVRTVPELRMADAEPMLTDEGHIRMEWHRDGIDCIAEIGPNSLWLCSLGASPSGTDDHHVALDRYDGAKLVQFFDNPQWCSEFNSRRTRV